VNTRHYFEHAKREGFAIGAFNVGDLVTLKAVVLAAQETQSPVIIEASHGEVGFLGVRQLSALVATYRAETGLPIILNLDHAPTSRDCLEALQMGFDYLHLDASEEDYETNVTESRRVVEAAHPRGRMVEVELDHITGSSSLHKESIKTEVAKGTFTDAERAARFMEETGADTLAVFIGNVHGIYPDTPSLDFDRLAAIRRSTSSFLSLHGGSGIPDEQIREAVRIGVDKINVNSEIRLLYRRTLDEILASDKDEIALYKLYPLLVERIRDLVTHKIRVFGSEGKA
jgi:fructose-bisphosphate aldolase, class II